MLSDPSRGTNPAQQSPAPQLYDLLIVGGGVNGAGIARDAAGRGASVLLVEQHDLASHTSSASTKLIHGGLRYLEYYEFRLVREALIERERLLAIAPHIIWPLSFVLPHSRLVRPAWMLRMGLFLYDHLGGRMTLPRSRGVRLDRDPVGKPLRPAYRRAFIYSDARVLDSRLVVLNAMDARARGADIRTRTRLVGARRVGGVWEATIEDASGRQTVRVRGLVNAAGPWVERVLRDTLAIGTTKQVRLVKGSHIVVPRRFEGEQAYIFQNPDRRIVFAIPYERDFTLIGTTDIPWTADPGDVRITEDEVRYLCDSVNRYFTKPVTPGDVVWSYAGVRPLYDDAAQNASAVTRDYVLDVDSPPEGGVLLSIFGGKITTYRRLAEHALEKLAPFLPVVGGRGWTAGQPLPGGDLGPGGFDSAVARLRVHAPFLPLDDARRLVRHYGTLAWDILGTAQSRADLGEDFGGGLTAREVEYLIAREWAVTAEDILWRRSRQGLHVDEDGQARLEHYLAARRQGAPGNRPAMAD
ncbi:glycerol-3-phosphate dehydrogenase [Gluconacetobacter sacchari DSM 12717]|uniref:Glycerol-3-phosphate dehydrogenase n=2 Tax=Gluconacetobacter sacchari TaxID=92759 RepID=A0A7W4IDJ1_9PROT|nr:glycerol-3-phosphate dehydrogenase [Gluconacetobacter sacchari]MBB2160878.1 glycerol-3-phosphate dehydrogenase [Gluconacetobacter sacchari]GBQ32202.1 glycerol-3-phosphate dehydrogenase [Gluconacetobacter sacchari DSM 12717]